MTELPDIQETKPNIPIPIMQVGVENVEVPFNLESKYGGFHQMVANVSMRTSLDAKTKGISMSRLLLTLKPYLELPLKSKLIKEILEKIVDNVGMGAAFMKFEFRLPIKRKSIISENEFPIYYKCRFEGQLYRIPTKKELDEYCVPQNCFIFYQGVTIQYASYCPCSAELCDATDEKGFPHNQRSFANILIQRDDKHYIWLEDIIEQVESRLVTIPYPIIKRVDEQEIGKLAAKHPMFVEDAIREISYVLNSMPGVIDWIVKCSHEESIHTSEAIATNYKGIKGGFDARRFI